jgi:hypothetical protein
MKYLALVLALASICFAAAEPVISLRALREVEASINDRMRSSVTDPYDLLGTARGSYVEGHGAVFTFEVNLVYLSPLAFSPFKPGATPEDIAQIHDRKARKAETLKETMRDLAMNASRTLTQLPDNENVTMEAFLFNYRWENTRGLAQRIVISAKKKQLLDAVTRHATGAALTSVFTEEEL